MNPQNEEIEKVNHQTLKAKEGNPSNIPKTKIDIALKTLLTLSIGLKHFKPLRALSLRLSYLHGQSFSSSSPPTTALNNLILYSIFEFKPNPSLSKPRSL